jgi:hypothetical protein
MRPGVRVALGASLVVASALGMGLASRFSYGADGGDQAELRLTWRTRAPQIEECRRLTQAEQEALPVHMRREVICEGRVSSYRLEVVVDGEPRHTSIVKGSGARGDRPLYVFDAIRLEPGHHTLDVVFERVGAAAGGADGADAPVVRGRETGSPGASGVPDRLELRESLELAAGEVALVTYDATARRLVLRHGGKGR